MGMLIRVSCVFSWFMSAFASLVCDWQTFGGLLVAITLADAFYVLRCNKDAVDEADNGDEDGL